MRVVTYWLDENTWQTFLRMEEHVDEEGVVYSASLTINDLSAVLREQLPLQRHLRRGLESRAQWPQIALFEE
jgi:hypothetical protein